MSNELQRKDPAGSLVKSLEKSFLAALPSHVTTEHFSRALLTEFRRVPELVKCTQESIASGVLTFAQLGLMIGVNGNGWLIPFKNRRDNCTDAVMVIGYQGLIDLVYRSDRVDSLAADVVCKNDQFDFEQGLVQKLSHRPVLSGPRGKPYAVYATANIKGSSRPVFVVMNQEEVMAVKDSSPGSKRRESPWNGQFESEMWKKTALRRLCKLLPKSVELQNALEVENKQSQRCQDVREVDAAVVDDRKLRSEALKNAGKQSPSSETPETPETQERAVTLKDVLNLTRSGTNEDWLLQTKTQFPAEFAACMEAAGLADIDSAAKDENFGGIKTAIEAKIEG